jgi:hypothetical protein
MLVTMDTGAPHLARIWNYWLGGKEYFPVDREAGDQLREACPEVVDAACDIRDFVGRVVTWLTAERGVRQFLDIGGGLPMAGETSQVARRVAPDSRVVYVESGRVAPPQARELLDSGPDGATRYVEGDFRAPAAILEAAAPTLDLSRPVAFMLLGLAGVLGNDQEMSYAIRQLMRAAAAGSCLVLAEGSAASPPMAAVAEQYAATGARIYYLRDRQRLRQLFDGLELIPPGVVPTPDWHPARPVGGRYVLAPIAGIPVRAGQPLGLPHAAGRRIHAARHGAEELGRPGLRLALLGDQRPGRGVGRDGHVTKDGDRRQADSRGRHIGAEVIGDAGAHSGEEAALRGTPQRPLSGSAPGARVVVGTVLRGNVARFHGSRIGRRATVPPREDSPFRP